MKPKRITLSKQTASAALVKSRRRCAICFGLFRDAELKEGQLAHLDHDPSNNRDDNLLFLCLRHHDQYDSRTSQSKGYTKEEVTRYQHELEEFLAASSDPAAASIARLRRQEPVPGSSAGTKGHYKGDLLGDSIFIFLSLITLVAVGGAAHIVGSFTFFPAVLSAARLQRIAVPELLKASFQAFLGYPVIWGGLILKPLLPLPVLLAAAFAIKKLDSYARRLAGFSAVSHQLQADEISAARLHRWGLMKRTSYLYFLACDNLSRKRLKRAFLIGLACLRAFSRIFRPGPGRIHQLYFSRALSNLLFCIRAAVLMVLVVYAAREAMSAFDVAAMSRQSLDRYIELSNKEFFKTNCRDTIDRLFDVDCRFYITYLLDPPIRRESFIVFVVTALTLAPALLRQWGSRLGMTLCVCFVAACNCYVLGATEGVRRSGLELVEERAHSSPGRVPARFLVINENQVSRYLACYDSSPFEEGWRVQESSKADFLVDSIDYFTILSVLDQRGGFIGGIDVRCRREDPSPGDTVEFPGT